MLRHGSRKVNSPIKSTGAKEVVNVSAETVHVTADADNVGAPSQETETGDFIDSDKDSANSEISTDDEDEDANSHEANAQQLSAIIGDSQNPVPSEPIMMKTAEIRKELHKFASELLELKSTIYNCKVDSFTTVEIRQCIQTLHRIVKPIPVPTGPINSKRRRPTLKQPPLSIDTARLTRPMFPYINLSESPHQSEAIPAPVQPTLQSKPGAFIPLTTKIAAQPGRKKTDKSITDADRAIHHANIKAFQQQQAETAKQFSAPPSNSHVLQTLPSISADEQSTVPMTEPRPDEHASQVSHK